MQGCKQVHMAIVLFLGTGCKQFTERGLDGVGKMLRTRPIRPLREIALYWLFVSSRDLCSRVSRIEIRGESLAAK